MIRDWRMSSAVRPLLPPQICTPARASKADGIVAVGGSCRLESGSGSGGAGCSAGEPWLFRQDRDRYVTH